MAGFNAARAKVCIKMALERTRMVAAKKEATAKKSRKEIATLLERGRIEFARARVEVVISDDIHVELLEILELYCELLQARFALLEVNTDPIDPAISEPVAGIIFAANRTEVRELHQLRDLLMGRAGRDFSHAVLSTTADDPIEGRLVSTRVLSKVPATAAPPDPTLVDAYLRTIAQAYGVTHPDLEVSAEEPASTSGPSADVPADISLASTASFATAREPSPRPPRQSSHEAIAAKGSGAQAGDVAPARAAEKDEYQALADRFAALKKR